MNSSEQTPCNIAREIEVDGSNSENEDLSNEGKREQPLKSKMRRYGRAKEPRLITKKILQTLMHIGTLLITIVITAPRRGAAPMYRHDA
ncbi:unnamed protein product [Cuscuta campestris]|uniref:Uncharacterized protein n=1 Tax=Cuscuta campestris TaxID=132261 RepID=A0A484L4G2_9ASTE|nr:unnamed protein product [Cuscuta campestris]